MIEPPVSAVAACVSLCRCNTVCWPCPARVVLTRCAGVVCVCVSGLLAAIENAKAVTDKPSIIKVTTTIGFGSKKEGTEGVHGSPLGADDIVQLKTKMGFDPTKSFVTPEEVKKHCVPVVNPRLVAQVTACACRGACDCS